MSSKSKVLSKGTIACVIALTLGATVLAPVALALVLGTADLNEVTEEWTALAVQLLIVVVPFGMLSLHGTNERRPWLVASALTLAFWSLLWLDAIVRRGAGGANIGLGLLMLVSPLIVTVGAAFSITATSEE